jgi:exodeoxyribonuclease X
MHASLAPAGRSLSETDFAVVDVETTGFDPGRDAVVEVACVRLRGFREIDAFATLVNPERPIPATASAVHHLTDADVAGAPRFAEVERELARRCAGAVIVAHNAPFDLSFLPVLAAGPSLCSMRFAKRAFPEAPNYKNQVLRYHLGITDPRLGRASAHGALADAIVTSRVFRRCLERYLAAGGPDDVEALLAGLARPAQIDALRFGRFRGLALSDVPDSYLGWVAAEAKSASDDERYSARRELERRSGAASRPVA